MQDWESVFRAAAGDVRVIERAVSVEQHETRRVVAVAALLRGHEVIRRLAGGCHAVVTVAALTENLGVIDETYGVERDG